MSRPGGKNNSLKQPKEEVNIKYMHRPPTITPNYGKQRRSMLPKSKVSRVLLYDNATQDHMLDIKLAHINIEKERISRIINLHKRSFSHRQLKKQHLRQQLATKSAGSKQNGVKRQHLPNDRSPKGDSKSISNGMDLMHLSMSSENNFLKDNVTQYGIEDDPKKEDLIDTTKDVPEVVKLPDIVENKGRHVIFKVKDTRGITKVYHTTLQNEDAILNDLLPMHRLYPKMTDDPRFRSLQDLLIPTDYDNDMDI